MPNLLKLATNKTAGGLTLVFLTLTGFASLACATTTAEWTLDKEEKGIQLYTRSVENSPFLAVKAVTKIKAPIKKVIAALGDGNGCTQWQNVCKSSKVFEKVSDDELFVYSVLDLPWPMSDRDMVVHSVRTTDPGNNTVTVILSSAADKHPKQKYVRAESTGSYVIKPLDEKSVEFTWTIHTNLGGSVSPSVINPQLASSTFKDVRSLVKLTED